MAACGYGGAQHLQGARHGLWGGAADDPVRRCVVARAKSEAGEWSAAAQRQLAQAFASGELQQQAGAPKGATRDILRLSAPPYVTACPNPFLGSFVSRRSQAARGETSPPCQEPYAGPLDPGPRHPVGSFHGYHTKVPPRVIRSLIEHYTRPGELVLDVFAGSGMTGVAAREAGRDAVLIDLSPAATFIAGVNSRRHDAEAARAVLEAAISDSSAELGFLYETLEGGTRLPVRYFVWSDVFTCSECGHEFAFFDAGVEHLGTKVRTRACFPCPACEVSLSVRTVRRVMEQGRKKKVLVWVHGGTGRERFGRAPGPDDLRLAEQAEGMAPPAWFPTNEVDGAGYSARLAQLEDKGITDVSRFLSRRNLVVFADLWERLGAIEQPGLRNLCLATLTSTFTVISERQGYFGGGGGMSGNLYMPIVRMEKNIYDVLRRRLGRMEAAERAKSEGQGEVLVSTQSATRLDGIPDNSVDYIYTDPPFGANIIYSEVNHSLEAWLRVRTDADPEAVIDRSRSRQLEDYAALMRLSFRECFRVLKPGHWMTVEFHNSQAKIWNQLQAIIGETGFAIARVGVLDKGSTTILGDIRPGAAKHDLIICARKPTELGVEGFALSDGSVEEMWRFVEEHLASLPPVDQSLEPPGFDRERSPHFLFDRMVAHHLEQRRRIPLSAGRFYRELRRRFVEDQGMIFTAGQRSLLSNQGRVGEGEAAGK